jgi:hypothetical protein
VNRADQRDELLSEAQARARPTGPAAGRSLAALAPPRRRQSYREQE